MTDELVENMVGHRTRLAQQDARYWHEQEDQALDSYLKISERMDRVGLQLNAVIARGYVDEENLFVTGGSGGGVLSSWIVGKPTGVM